MIRIVRIPEVLDNFFSPDNPVHPVKILARKNTKRTINVVIVIKIDLPIALTSPFNNREITDINHICSKHI